MWEWSRTGSRSSTSFQVAGLASVIGEFSHSAFVSAPRPASGLARDLAKSQVIGHCENPADISYPPRSVIRSAKFRSEICVCNKPVSKISPRLGSTPGGQEGTRSAVKSGLKSKSCDKGRAPSAGSLIAGDRVRERTSSARPRCAGQQSWPAISAASTIRFEFHRVL